MAATLQENHRAISKKNERIFYSFSALIFIFAFLGLYTETWMLAVLPIGILGLVLILKDIRILYYGFFALLPFSVEVELGLLGTDLPSEPMMLALTGIAFLLFLKNIKQISARVVYHPITVLIILHVLWILVTAIFSQYPLFSFKFFLAKLWYVIPFYFLGFYMLKTNESVNQVFRYSSVFLASAVGIVLVRHGLEGFTFDTSNEVVYPIFRNHVNYAAMVVSVIPYMWARWSKNRSIWPFMGIILMILGAYFSYTRAAHLCIFIMIGAYFVFRHNLGKYAMIASLICAVVMVAYFTTENKYLDFAPDFNKTISHDKFGNLVEATYKLEDISTMERVYRWVAGGHMIAERPLLGYGPSGFYHNYTKFTVTSFETYVSDNPEKSGIHCYYLMTWVEQGIVGMLLFLSLCVTIILVGERAYNRTIDNDAKKLIMAATLSTVSICALLLINDLIEADKVGPFFFFNAVVIAIYDLKSRVGISGTKTNAQ